MVIIVRGTNTNHNKAAHVTAALAGMSSIRKSRKSLILQFCKSVSIEDLLIGKKKAETDILEIGFMYEDTGIDALIRRAKTMRLTKEHFDACCTPILNAENMLDIAVMSRKDNFEDEMVESADDIGALLSQAQAIYDDIFIYANAQNHALMNVLNQFADLSIICLRQGIQEQVEDIPEKYFYLVTAYDYNSTFTVRYLRNLYKVKNISELPYSVEFKDAYNMGTLMQFLGKNERIGKQDVTYTFINAIDGILTTYFEDKTPKEKELPQMEGMKNHLPDKDLVDEYATPDVEVTMKKRLFSSKTKKVVKDADAASEPKRGRTDKIEKKPKRSRKMTLPEVAEEEIQPENQGRRKSAKNIPQPAQPDVTYEEEPSEDAFGEQEYVEEYLEGTVYQEEAMEEAISEDVTEVYQEEATEEAISEDVTEAYQEETYQEETYQETAMGEDTEAAYEEVPAETMEEEHEPEYGAENSLEEPAVEEIETVADEEFTQTVVSAAMPQYPAAPEEPAEVPQETWRCPVCGTKNTDRICRVCSTRRPGFIR